MKDKIEKYKRSIKKFTRICKNILVNALKELFSSNKVESFKRFLKAYKFALVIALIIIIFILKNIYTLNVYNSQIKLLEDEIKNKQASNEQLKDDLEYYKTDEFILRYALEELNMRPTKDSKLFHGEVLPYEKPEDTNSENNESTDDTSIEAEDSNEDEKNSTDSSKDAEENNNSEQDNE